MWHLFLDESGDLGFDFVSKKPSKFFTICILATSDVESYYAIRKAVKKTLRRKVNKGGQARNPKHEIKGTGTTHEAKVHFYDQIKSSRFGLYAITLNKRRLYEYLTKDKERVYNYVARLVLDRIPFEKALDRVHLTVDKSKGQTEIREFNFYVIGQLKGRLDPKVALNIDHMLSEQEPGLQAVDLFGWGIFRKYEKNDEKWRRVFSEKVIFDEVYLKEKERAP